MVPLIQALLDPRCYPHPVASVRLIETHISWVLLTGRYAYKIKKPLRLDFLDFSSLGLRRRHCREELRLNARFAPGIYLDVVAISGDPAHPQVDGDGEAIEYAVKMLEFEQDCLFDRRLQEGRLDAADIDALAHTCARVHAAAAVAAPGSAHGTSAVLAQQALDNFRSIARLGLDECLRSDLAGLQHWTESAHARLAAELARRKAGGRIRECHGDLHLGNIALIAGEPMLFDCIEFDERLRWIDVMSEIAFTVMDLHVRGRPDLGARLLDRYLQASGDYAGAAVLRFYLVYRAMVRAKIAAIRASQEDHAPAPGEALPLRRHVDVAGAFARGAGTFLAITCGLSGSGKTYLSERVVERTQAIRIRSDVERKRLAGLDPLARSDSALDGDLYARQASDRTFERLEALARTLLEAGHPVVVDATFIERDRRLPFQALAASLGVPFVVLHCRATDAVLARRIEQRLARGKDASEADHSVLEAQRKRQQPVEAAECSHLIEIDGTDPASVQAMLERLVRLAAAG